jgi:hypothetical protein
LIILENACVVHLVMKIQRRTFLKNIFVLFSIGASQENYIDKGKLMVTNCSREKSFLRLKHVKNELRTAFLHEKLSTLSTLCIESDRFRTLTFQYIINDSALENREGEHFNIEIIDCANTVLSFTHIFAYQY